MINYEQGYEDGHSDGQEVGWDEGYDAGLAESAPDLDRLYEEKKEAVYQIKRAVSQLNEPMDPMGRLIIMDDVAIQLKAYLEAAGHEID